MSWYVSHACMTTRSPTSTLKIIAAPKAYQACLEGEAHQKKTVEATTVLKTWVSE